MIIACNINNDYIRHCAVMLRSLYEANPRVDLDVFIVHSRLDGKERAKLVGYLSEFLPSVSLIQIDDSMLQEFPESAHVKLASYYRIFLPDILPGVIDRIIYIDSDVVVNGCLEDLWQLPLDGYRLAAATDRNLPMQRSRLGLNHDSPYFNAGIMTFHLSEWRKLDLASRGLEIARKVPEKLLNCDQDVLNILFENQCRMIHQRWNAMPHLWGLDRQWLLDQGGLSVEEEEAIADPAIIHFAGAGFAKPWHAKCPHPWRDRYRELLAQTPWGNTPLEGAIPESSLWQRSLAKLRRGVGRIKTALG
jgi:lipopolysaccharide biosynthesis glycosyltransferase